MSEKKTDIEDLPPAEMGHLDDLDLGADFLDGDLPDLEESDDLLDPFVGDSTGLDPLNGSADTGLDDLPPTNGGQALTHAELDDVLDDLEPHHLEDEDSTLPDVMAEQMPTDGDDLESITLSEEELDNILGTGQDVLVDADATEMPDPEEMRAAPVSGFAPDQSDFDADLESGGSFDELGLDEEFPDVSGETLTPLDGDLELLDEQHEDSSPDFGEEPVLMDDFPNEIGDDLVAGPALAAPPMHAPPEPEEGPVALSEEELDNILGDVDLAEPMELSTYAAGDEAEDDDVLAAAPPSSMEDEEEITLSDDELSNVLLDTDDEGGFGSGAAGADTDLLDDFPGDDLLSEPADLDEEMAGGGAPSILDGDDDEDEPVTLSMEELGNIVSDVATEEAEDTVPLPDEEQSVASILDGDEDEGPVALSEDELSNILEDVDEEQAEDFAAPAQDADERNIIVLDEYEDAGETGKAAAATLPAVEPDRSELVASTAARANVDPGEVKKVISYLDRLFDQLPEETIREFSKSEYFDLYKKLMGDLGLLK